ncbi:MAG TPA: helix-turn-helix transcriptional regulator [Burkholderiales bacterium]
MKKSVDAMLRENLRREMARRHLSETDLAHRTGLSVSTLQQLTAGEGEPASSSLARVQRLAEALGMPAAQLLTEESAPAGRAARNIARESDETPRQLSHLIESFFALPEADRRALLATAAEMAQKYRVHVRA